MKANSITPGLMAIAVFFAAAFLLTGSHAKDGPPDRLTIDYENEGKIDASDKACLAFVKETTEWSKAETEEAAKRVCVARRRHLDAYEALQSNYRTLMQDLAKDVRLDPAGAAANLKILVKACIEHKQSLTTGGHNIMIDVIENDIDGECLTYAAHLLRDEIDELRSLRQRAGWTNRGRNPP